MTSNPRNIEWPQDTTGFLYQLKNAGVKAAERQMGNKEKHEALMQTLRKIAQHAVARYERQAAIRAAAIAAVAGDVSAAPVEVEPEPVTDPVVVTPEPAAVQPEPAVVKTENTKVAEAIKA